MLRRNLGGWRIGFMRIKRSYVRKMMMRDNKKDMKLSGYNVMKYPLETSCFLSGIVAVLFFSVTAHAHTIYPIDSCDDTFFGVEQIPCIMRKKGWSDAAELMDIWFSDNHGKNYIIPIQIPKELSNDLPESIEKSIEKMKKKSLVEDYKNGIPQYLLNALNSDPEYFPFINKGQDFSFDFIKKEIDEISSTNLNNWHTGEEEKDDLNYIREKSIQYYYKYSGDINSEFTAAFGRSSLRLVVKGDVSFLSENIAKITVTEGGVYFRDSYDFGNQKSLISLFQPLGCWSTEEPFVNYYPANYNTNGLDACITNADFRLKDIKGDHDYRIFTLPERFFYEERPEFYVDNYIGKFEFYNSDDYPIPDPDPDPDPESSGTFTCDNVDFFQINIGNWGGQCVPYVRKETGIEYECCNGYAKNCYDQARSCGYATGDTPAENSIVTFDDWNGNPYGHVGIVIDVDKKNDRIKLRHSNWHLNEVVSEEWVSTNNLPIKGYIYCGGNYGNNGNGKGGEDPNVDPYDPWEGYKNAVGIDSVRGSEEGEDDWEYVIEVPLDDIYDMDFRVKLKRKGGVWPDEVEASFYLSEDDTFDSGDVFLGSEDKDLSDEAEKKRSVYVDDVDMADFINEPGEYYVYVAVAYGTGTNRSTSRDKKERVKIIVTDETPLSDGTFIWSPNGAVPGMTCTQWKEPADPHSWGDNFLCTTRNEDIRWSADGPIAGMRCTQIYESQDPHFNNNYLCVPNESTLAFLLPPLLPWQGHLVSFRSSGPAVPGCGHDISPGSQRPREARAGGVSQKQRGGGYKQKAYRAVIRGRLIFTSGVILIKKLKPSL
ncbi:MAG: CHAP domain-containing protein [Candidatus Electrothrix sp. ATG2]|nr:CHAP domain-containing protein [Candidatus Electrothrix sp. ATG2]